MHRQAARGRRKAPRRRAPRRKAAHRSAPRRSASRRNVGALIAGGVGEVMLTAGALVLLFVVYTLWGTGIQTASAQNELRDQLEIGVGQIEKEPLPLDQLELGDAYGIIRIPRFGDDWEWILVQGVDDADLKNGPGHYLDSANPGELGNFSIAAHRSGHCEPFAQFPELQIGDTVEIETAAGTFVYQLDDAPDGDPDGNRIGIRESWVVNPVPGEALEAEPTERRITLTTCWPRFGSSHRMFATGVLVDGEEV